jgi:YD repeat-containing protein
MLVTKYTTANSNTFALPNGHMLTQVYEHPINRRDSTGNWQPLSATQAASSNARPGASPATSATANAERNPLGQENELACTLTSTTPTASACNGLTFKAGYETAAKSALHGLIQFTLPDLHEELIVLNAQLELYAAKTSTTTGVAMGAYRVTTPWTTGATWNTTNGSTSWHTPGGDYANPEKESDAAINPSVGTKTGWTYWYPTRMVQEWYNGTIAPNGQGQPDLGFLLKDVSEGTTNNAVTFDGREERERNPGLTLEWVQRGVGNATNDTQLPIKLSGTQGLSVNPASGNLSIHSADLQIPSKGFAFESARTWNSLQNEAPGYGYGWVDSNAVRVQVMPSGNVGYTDSNGNTFPFIKEGANFRTPPGIEATMCEAGSAAPCPTTLPTGTLYQLIYTNSLQRLNFGWKEKVGNFLEYWVVSVQDASGDTQTAKYSGTLEDPVSWKDTEGTEIAYTESESKGYTKITDVGNGHPTSYTETLAEDGLYHLTQYTNESKEVTKYRYGGESFLEGNLLTEITEPNGTVIKLYYDSEYRVVKIIRTTNAEHTKGPTTTYTYYERGKAPAPCTVTQKATVVTETEGNEEPTITYCSNVLDEVEEVSGYPATGQPGWYILDEQNLGESETELASVNLASGDLLVRAEDVAPEATDQHMRLDRFYNSQAMPMSSTLGPRWGWGTGPGVYLVDEGATVVLHGPSGYTVVLKRTSANTYSGPAGFEGTLAKNANGTYTLTNQDNPKYEFNAAGVLTSETSEEGNTFSVTDTTLSGKSVLQKLVAPNTSALEAKYNATPEVTQTTDPGARNRLYGYNAALQLTSYTAPGGAKTEYEYSNGYLSKIIAPNATETITTTSGRVSEVTMTPKGGTTSTRKYTYQAPTSPTCNPATDAGETLVTPSPEGEVETVCYNAHGEFTGPNVETEESSEETSGTEEPAEEPNETCAEITEFSPEECVEEEIPPRSVEEEESAPLARTALEQLAQPAAKAPPAPTTVEYGISDNNNLTTGFNYFAEKPFQELKAVNVRRIIPWDLVTEAERTASPEHAVAEAELADVVKWVEDVKALNGGHGQPLISFDHCRSGNTWYDAERKTERSCLEAPTHGDYKLAVEAFLKHAVLSGVKRFTAWNEPNNFAPVPGQAGSHVEPTWNQGELAGKYWRALYTLCKPTKYNCEVAAGDFIDGSMQNAFNPFYINHKKEKVVSKTHQYFVNYWKGMGRPSHVARWAWHAYSEGKAIEVSKGLRSTPKKWWQSFKNFAAEVHRITHSTATNFWMTEQGVIFSYKKEELKAGKRFVEEEEPLGKRYRSSDHTLANDVMNAFVNRGRYQLTRVNNSITQFYYYETRGSRNSIGSQDSGLLEIVAQPGLPTPYGIPASTPRSIYGIYKAKVPTGP